MKSNIRFESNASPETVNFLDVNVQLINNKLKTSLYTKATDAHLYLNAKSCHPNHVIRNIPKGQLVRVRRICSDINDYDLNSNRMIRYFISRGYKKVHLEKIQLSVRNMSRKDLLLNSENNDKKDSNTVFICTWHPTLAKLPLLVERNYSILDNDQKLKKIFPEKPRVVFRRRNNLKDILCKNDISNPNERSTEHEEPTKKCKGCQFCGILQHCDTLINPQNGCTIKTKPGTCLSVGVIYALKCKKCQLLYVGQTGDNMKKRFGQHKYDIKKRPDQNELAKHFKMCKHDTEDIMGNLECFIIDHGLHEQNARKRVEDRTICRLQTMGSSGLNELVGPYAKEMYCSWSSFLNSEK